MQGSRAKAGRTQEAVTQRPSGEDRREKLSKSAMAGKARSVVGLREMTMEIPGHILHDRTYPLPQYSSTTSTTPSVTPKPNGGPKHLRACGRIPWSIRICCNIPLRLLPVNGHDIQESACTSVAKGEMLIWMFSSS